MSYLTILKNIFGSRTGGDEFQKFNQFFLVHRYICGKIFTKLQTVLVYENLLKDRQTDRQTNAGYYRTSLTEVIK